MGGAVLSLVGAVAILATFAGGAGAAPPTTDGPTAAGYGAAWLADRLDEQIPMENFGSPDWGVTLDAALGMAAVGAGGAQVDSVWSALVADRDAALSPGGVESPGRLARAILLAGATGADPRAVGDAPGADLVARLEAIRQTDGPDAGLFGDQNPTYDGAFRQGYSIAALVAVGVTPDPSSVDWLLAQQCGPEADPGAWMPYRTDLSTPCAADSALFVGPDTNATAAAITGLTAVSAGSDAIEAGLNWLDGVQEADGGWGQMVGYGTDPNSTALVLQALIAAGDSDATRFADRAATPLAALLAFQLGCDAPDFDRGAFTFPGSNDAPNGFATAQAVAPAAGAGVLAESGPIDPGVTPLNCDSPTTSTTTTVAPTTVAPTTVAPTTVAPTTVAPTSTVPTGAAAVPVSAAPQVAGRSQSATPAPASGSASASSSGTANLARTGAPGAPLATLGGLAVVAGLILIAGSRRRNEA